MTRHDDSKVLEIAMFDSDQYEQLGALYQSDPTDEHAKALFEMYLTSLHRSAYLYIPALVRRIRKLEAQVESAVNEP